MSASNTLRRTYRVGPYRTTWALTLGPGGQPTDLQCEWDPCRPRRMGGQMLRRYRQARGEFMELAAEAIGGPVLTVEV